VRAVVDPNELRALITEAQDGNVRAFELLMASHLSQVRRFARAFARSEADADDLAQEALVKVYKSLRSFRFQASFKTWLYSVVRHVFIDNTRSRTGQARSREEALPEDHSQVPSPTDTPDESLTRSQERQRMWRALRQLPTDFRTPVVLFDVEGHTYEEVAAIEGVPIGTVKSRLSRGRALLRALLADEQGADTPGSKDTAGTYRPRTSSQGTGANDE
jgi:RNA polymerase sigma-70 factor (ECF subfamily)